MLQCFENTRNIVLEINDSFIYLEFFFGPLVFGVGDVPALLPYATVRVRELKSFVHLERVKCGRMIKKDRYVGGN